MFGACGRSSFAPADMLPTIHLPSCMHAPTMLQATAMTCRFIIPAHHMQCRHHLNTWTLTVDLFMTSNTTASPLCRNCKTSKQRSSVRIKGGASCAGLHAEGMPAYPTTEPAPSQALCCLSVLGGVVVSKKSKQLEENARPEGVPLKPRDLSV